MKHYFYSSGENQKGPLTFEQLKKENIDKDTLIWFEGIEDWTKAKYILELEEILQLSPPPIIMNDSEIMPKNDFNKVEDDNSRNNEETQRKRKKERVYENINIPHPWRRFFARTLDLITTGLLVLFLFSYMFGLLFPNNIDSYLKIIENPIGSSIVLYLLWIPFESLFLYLIGTTPAKWLFGIYVKKNRSENLSYTQALMRTFQVFVSGEGFAIPLITLFTRMAAYRRLTRTNTTSWDSDIGSIVLYEEWHEVKVVASFIISILALILLSILNSGL